MPLKRHDPLVEPGWGKVLGTSLLILIALVIGIKMW